MFKTLEEADGVEWRFNYGGRTPYRCELIKGKLVLRNLIHDGLVTEILLDTLNNCIEKGDWVLTKVPDRISEDTLWE